MIGDIMEIIDLLQHKDMQKYFLKLKDCDWVAGRYLYNLIVDNKFEALCGKDSKVYMIVNCDDIVSFCTYVYQDEIRDETLYPWIGFVYTNPNYRGNRYFGKLLNYIIIKAKGTGYKKIYVSTNEVGLYEKYGFVYFKNMLDFTGNDSRIYYIEI